MVTVGSRQGSITYLLSLVTVKHDSFIEGESELIVVAMEMCEAGKQQMVGAGRQ